MGKNKFTYSFSVTLSRSYTFAMFRVCGLGFRFGCLGFGVRVLGWGLGFRFGCLGFGFGCLGFGLRVLGLGFGVGG